MFSPNFIQLKKDLEFKNKIITLLESLNTRSKKNFSFLSCEVRLGWKWPQLLREVMGPTHRDISKSSPFTLTQMLIKLL